jgi:hypothetical protein
MKHLRSFNEAKKNWTIQDIFDRIKEIEDAKFVKIKGKGDKIPLTDEMKRKDISALEDIIEDFFNEQGIRYERKYKTLKERKYVTKYMNFKPFYLEDQEEICDFFGQELEKVTGLKYGKNFIVKLYNLDRGNDLVDDGSGYPDFKTNTYQFTMLVPIGTSDIELESKLYIVRRFVFDLKGDVVELKNSNARGLKERQISKVSTELDYVKIKKFLSQPHYVNFIEEENEEEINKSK